MGLTISNDPAQVWNVAVITLVALVYVFLIQRLKSGKGDRDWWFERVAQVAVLLPHRRDELRRFYWLSLTAGVVEEVLWRGYLIWYFSLVMPLWVAVVVSSVLFGLGHAYQGIKNVPSVVLLGAVFAWLYVSTGSLLLAVVFHALFDALQGRFLYEVVGETGILRVHKRGQTDDRDRDAGGIPEAGLLR